MKYYTEISNIVRGALHNDKKVVSAFTQQLIEKLKNDGEVLAGKGLSDHLLASANLSVQEASASYNLSKPVPVEKDNRFALADKSYPTLKETTVFLSEKNENTVDSFLKYLFKKGQLETLGIPINPTLLLHGRPGTGKSKLAQHLAAKLELPLITARADALISSYLGSTAKNIRSLLEYAQNEPCVLFLDEFDAIAKARDDKNEIGELKRVVVSLLQNIDNLGDTILIAATNHVHLLDPAIGRRFHYKLELLPPECRERFNLFHALLEQFDFDSEGIGICVAASEGLTGAEIEMATYEYLRFSIINDQKPSYIGLLKELLKVMYPWISFEGDDSRYEGIHRLKEINPELYTGKLLSQLWNISASYVSRLMKEHK